MHGADESGWVAEKCNRVNTGDSILLDMSPASALAHMISDEEIVTRVRSGEIDLYEVLIRRYNQRLFRVARSILRDDAEAEDVMQDAYVRGYEHLNSFAGEAKFSTWLTKIAVYEALHRLRKRSKTGDLDSVMATATTSSPSPERQTYD